MKSQVFAYCLSLCGLALAGCQSDAKQPAPEMIEVSAQVTQLAPDASYNIDLRRDDAVFHLAPGLDPNRLTVTCPTGPQMNFLDYVDLRVLPMAGEYSLESEHLFLAGGALPDQFWTPVMQPLATTTEMCWYCKDEIYEECTRKPCPPL